MSVLGSIHVNIINNVLGEQLRKKTHTV